MREVIFKLKVCLWEFNICCFKELNEKFLIGYLMLVFIDFYKDE